MDQNNGSILDFFVPYINSGVQDDNPEGVSQSLPTANGGGFGESAVGLLDKLLTYNLQKDQLQYQASVAAKGASVSTPQAVVAAAGGSKVVLIGLGVLGLFAAVWAVKKLA